MDSLKSLLQLNMKKAVLSNRIYLDVDEETKAFLAEKLTYKIPRYRADLPPEVIYSLREITPTVVSIPSGCADLIPEDYHFIDRSVLVPVTFPKFKYELREDQQEIYNLVNSSCRVKAPPSWGKAQPASSTVLTTKGWISIKDVKVGDYVVTPSNNKAKVVGKFFNSNKPIYEVTLLDGRKVRACENHLWKAITRYKTQVVTTKDLIKMLENKNLRVSLPLTDPITSNLEQELPIHPYVLGILLSEGGITQGSPIFSTADPFIKDKMSKLIPKSCKVIDCTDKYSFRLTSNIQGKNEIIDKLKDLGLWGCNSYTKFIPEEYKNLSFNQTIDLLNGLFDGDGSIESNGAIEYASSSKKLIEDTAYLIYKLGGSATVQSRHTQYTYKGQKLDGKTSYRFRPSRLPTVVKSRLFSLPRKLERVKKQKLDDIGRIPISSIEYIGTEDCWCISLDSEDKLYLTDSFIVTHNTFTAIAIAAKLGQKTLIVTHNVPLRRQWEKEVKKVLGITPTIIGSGTFDISGSIVVGNIQSVSKHGLKIAKMFGTVIVDECHHCPASTFASILDTSHARYKLGFSASDKRKDGRHCLFTDYFGSKVYEADRANAMDPSVEVVRLPIRFADGQGSWPEKVNELCANEEYIKYIVGIADSYVVRGHKVLVVGPRVGFLNTCARRSSAQALAVTSKVGQDVRDDLEKNLKSGDLEVIYGTQSIFSEGISLPPLSVLILAGPLNNTPLLEQLIGRIERMLEGKLDPIIVDPHLIGKTISKQASARMDYYILKGYNISFF